MQSKSLALIAEQLQKERNQLSERANKLRQELAQLDKDLARIDAASKALSTDQPTPPARKEGKAKQARKPHPPAPKKADVVLALEQILHDQSVLETAELQKFLEDHLIQRGFSRLGLAMRFKEALGESRFIDTPAGIRLNDEADVPAPA